MHAEKVVVCRKTEMKGRFSEGFKRGRRTANDEEAWLHDRFAAHPPRTKVAHCKPVA